MLQKQLRRYRFDLEYCGDRFFGWQRQPGLPTVQEALECAASELCGTSVQFVCAGRTDTGVHALGQVVHADIPTVFQEPLKALFFGLNQKLIKKGVVVKSVEEVDPTFHARFSARRRTYMYRVLDRGYPTVVDKSRVWFVRAPLDVGAVREGAAMLVGEHDFKSFQSHGCSAKTSVRHMYEVRVNRHDESGELRLTFVANAFLYHQVRNMVGALVHVGGGRLSVEHFRELFVSLEPRKRVRMAPAVGLYLLSVCYEEKVNVEGGIAQ